MKVIFQLTKAEIQAIVAEKFGLAFEGVELIIKVGLDILTFPRFSIELRK